jgi:hypothetical protein
VKLVYIAGAYRAPTRWEVSQNIRRAEEAGLEVARAGAMPVIPQANTGNFHGELTDQFWLEGSREQMRRCDAVLVYDQTQLARSDGTAGEVLEAEQIGMPIFYSVTELTAWLGPEHTDWMALGR